MDVGKEVETARCKPWKFHDDAAAVVLSAETGRGRGSKQVGKPIKHSDVTQVGLEGFYGFAVIYDTAVAFVVETEAATGDWGRVQDRGASIKRGQNKRMHQIKQCNASADGMLVLANHTSLCYMTGRKVEEDE